MNIILFIITNTIKNTLLLISKYTSFVYFQLLLIGEIDHNTIYIIILFANDITDFLDMDKFYSKLDDINKDISGLSIMMFSFMFLEIYELVLFSSYIRQ